MVWYALPMKLMLIAGLLVFSGILSAESQQWLLRADTWAKPRNGLVVTQMPPLPDVVASWSEDTNQRLIIHYPGGESGQLWAYELRSWMVSLGVPLKNLELVAGGEEAGEIVFELSR